MSRITVPFFMGEPMPFLGQVLGDAELTPDLPDASPQERMGVLYRHLADVVAADDAPMVFSGDCVVAIGVLAGLQREGIDPTLLWFDAHGDFHTWETTASGFLGGCRWRCSRGGASRPIVEAAGQSSPRRRTGRAGGGQGPRPRRGRRGCRIRHDGGRMWTACTALDLPGPLYVHVDVDVVDPEDLPGRQLPGAGRAVARGHAGGRWSTWRPPAGGGVLGVFVEPGVPGGRHRCCGHACGLAAPFEA